MDWISLTMLPNHLDFTGPDHGRCRVECPSRISVDSATAAKGLALAGMGLAPLLELEVEVEQELADNQEDRKSNRTGGCRRADATIAGRRVARAARTAREPTERDGDEVAISEGAEWA